MPSEVVAGLIAQGIKPQSGYGMTESCGHQYTMPEDEARLIIETSGKCCAGYELRVFKENDPDTEAATGEVGQLGGRGASLMLGYFDDQEATEEAFNKSGWFMTGDLGSIDAHGLSAHRRPQQGHHHPRRPQHPSGAYRGTGDAASGGAARRRGADEGRAAGREGLPRRGDAGPARTWRRPNCSTHLDAAGLSKYDMPEYFLRLDEIPLTPNGKMLKRAILDWIEAGRVTPQPVRFDGKRSRDAANPN